MKFYSKWSNLQLLTSKGKVVFANSQCDVADESIAQAIMNMPTFGTEVWGDIIDDSRVDIPSKPKSKRHSE